MEGGYLLYNKAIQDYGNLIGDSIRIKRGEGRWLIRNSNHMFPQ